MGTDSPLPGAFAVHDSNCWDVSLELSMAPVFPSRARDLRGGSDSAQAGFSEPGYSGIWTCRFDERCGADLPHKRFVRFSTHLDFSWIGVGLVLFGTCITRFQIAIVVARGGYIFRVALHVSLHPDKLWSSALQFFSRTPQT